MAPVSRWFQAKAIERWTQRHSRGINLARPDEAPESESLRLKLQSPESFGSVKTAGEHGIEREKSFIRVIATIEIDPPFRTGGGLCRPESTRRNSHFSRPPFMCFVHPRCGFKAAAPIKVIFGQHNPHVEPFIGGRHFIFRVVCDLIGFAPDESLDHITFPEAEPFGCLHGFEHCQFCERAIEREI